MTSPDTGYRPHSWLPLKITVAVGSAVTAASILLWRRRLVALGLVVAFAALATAWFIPDGYIQTMRDGHPICCGRIIDRGWLRASIGVVGIALGCLLVVLGLLGDRRDLSDPEEKERRLERA